MMRIGCGEPVLRTIGLTRFGRPVMRSRLLWCGMRRVLAMWTWQVMCIRGLSRPWVRVVVPSPV